MIQEEKIDNTISVITIDTGKGNMLGVADLQLLMSIISREKENSQTHGVILKGSNKCFCTGLVVGEITAEERLFLFKTFDILLYQLFCFPKPVIVASNGHSIGGGLLIQLCADYIVMSSNEKIKIGLPELKLNTTLDSLMIQLLKYSIGNMRSIQELVYSSQYIQPIKSLEYRLCDVVIDDSEVFEHALLEMKKIISYNQDAFASIKHSIRKETAERMFQELSNECYKVYI